MKYYVFIFLTIFNASAFCQPIFISAAEIEFERRVNLWAGLESTEFSEKLREATPQYQSDNFHFIFNDKKALYKPSGISGAVSTLPARDNTVFSDFETNTYIAQKNVFEKTYLVEDSLRNATWKITNDFREIAGFTCRRATTIIMDSVFVVAFYTDEIVIPGGPENINGLPGMILGLVINRIHTTWYAKKVTVATKNHRLIAPPAKGIRTTQSELLKTVTSSFANWGKEAEIATWQTML